MTIGFDLGPAVDLLSFDTVSVTRRTSSYNSQGVAVLGAPSTFSTRMSLQPLGAPLGPNAGGRAGLAGTTGLNLDMNVEGQRLHGAVVGYGRTQLFISSGGDVSDEVSWKGTSWTVVHSEPWSTHGYWRTILVKKVP